MIVDNTHSSACIIVGDIEIMTHNIKNDVHNLIEDVIISTDLPCKYNIPKAIIYS